MVETVDVVEGVEVDGGGDRSAQLFGGLSGNHGGRGRDVVEVTISIKKKLLRKFNNCFLFLTLHCSLTSHNRFRMKTGYPIENSLKPIAAFEYR